MLGCFDHKLQALAVLNCAIAVPYCDTAGNGAFSNAAIKVSEDLCVCGNWNFFNLLRKSSLCCAFFCNLYGVMFTLRNLKVFIIST